MEASMEPAIMALFPYVRSPAAQARMAGGARLAVWIVPNIEFFPLSIGIPGSPYDTRRAAGPHGARLGQHDYGNRWHLADHGGVRKSAASALRQPHSDICDHHPQIVKAASSSLGDPRPQRDQFALAQPDGAGEERQSIARVWRRSRASAKAGRLARRRARRDLATLDNLIDEGCLYVADWVQRRPAILVDVGGGKRIVLIPYRTRSTIRRSSIQGTVRSTSSSRR